MDTLKITTPKGQTPSSQDIITTMARSDAKLIQDLTNELIASNGPGPVQTRLGVSCLLSFLASYGQDPNPPYDVQFLFDYPNPSKKIINLPSVGNAIDKFKDGVQFQALIDAARAQFALCDVQIVAMQKPEVDTALQTATIVTILDLLNVSSDAWKNNTRYIFKAFEFGLIYLPLDTQKQDLTLLVTLPRASLRTCFEMLQLLDPKGADAAKEKLDCEAMACRMVDVAAIRIADYSKSLPSHTPNLPAPEIIQIFQDYQNRELPQKLEQILLLLKNYVEWSPNYVLTQLGRTLQGTDISDPTSFLKAYDPRLGTLVTVPSSGYPISKHVANYLSNNPLMENVTSCNVTIPQHASFVIKGAKLARYKYTERQIMGSITVTSGVENAFQIYKGNVTLNGNTYNGVRVIQTKNLVYVYTLTGTSPFFTGTSVTMDVPNPGTVEKAIPVMLIYGLTTTFPSPYISFLSAIDSTLIFTDYLPTNVICMTAHIVFGYTNASFNDIIIPRDSRQKVVDTVDQWGNNYGLYSHAGRADRIERFKNSNLAALIGGDYDAGVFSDIHSMIYYYLSSDEVSARIHTNWLNNSAAYQGSKPLRAGDANAFVPLLISPGQNYICTQTKNDFYTACQDALNSRNAAPADALKPTSPLFSAKMTFIFRTDALPTFDFTDTTLEFGGFLPGKYRLAEMIGYATSNLPTSLNRFVNWVSKSNYSQNTHSFNYLGTQSQTGDTQRADLVDFLTNATTIAFPLWYIQRAGVDPFTWLPMVNKQVSFVQLERGATVPTAIDGMASLAGKSLYTSHGYIPRSELEKISPTPWSQADRDTADAMYRLFSLSLSQLSSFGLTAASVAFYLESYYNSL
jgi:hypothetical protein